MKREEEFSVVARCDFDIQQFSGIAMAKSETRPANGTTKEQRFGVEQGEVINSVFLVWYL